MASVTSKIGGDRHKHLEPTMAVEDYMLQTGYTLVTPKNPGDPPPTLKTTQEQALGTERLRQNEALFRRCTAVDRLILKTDNHGGATSLHVPTGGQVDEFHTGDRNSNNSTNFKFL